jgi:hypothetical protein
MNEAQNWVTILALLSWPAVALWLYRTRPLNQATVWTILGGQLVLPVGTIIKLAPGIPQLDKTSVPSLAAILGCVLIARQRIRFFSRIGVTEALLLMLFVGPFITAALNGDVVFTGGTPLPGLTYYDSASWVESQFTFLLPFFLGRQFLRTAEDSAEILRTLVIAGLLYSIPMLVEVRLSPQLHNWVYGYRALGDVYFSQQIRNGGYRPTVFMGHGLVVAFFTMTAVVAAAALWRTRTRVIPASPAVVTAYLGVILVLCKSLGAQLYAVVLVYLVRLATPRMQLRVAVVLATIALAYPLARMTDLIPTRLLLEWSASYSAEREESLGFRFAQEGQLLERASQRFIFGWGGYTRNHVYNIESGTDNSITDGRWIITLGNFGLFGFLAEFGLLALPVFRAARALRFAESGQDRVFLCGLTLIVAINMFDLLPNDPLTPWAWLLSGAVLGRAEALRAAIRSPSRLLLNRTLHRSAKRA